MPETAVKTHKDTNDFQPLASVAELEGALRSIGREQAYLDKYERQLAAELDEVRKRYLKLIEKRRVKIRTLYHQAEEYCKTHKDELLDGQSTTKTCQLQHGDVTFQQGRPSVVLSEPHDVLVRRLRQAGLTQAIRTREEVDKRVVLARPEIADLISGIAIEQAEEIIVIKPAVVAL